MEKSPDADFLREMIGFGRAADRVGGRRPNASGARRESADGLVQRNSDHEWQAERTRGLNAAQIGESADGSRQRVLFGVTRRDRRRGLPASGIGERLEEFCRQMSDDRHGHAICCDTVGVICSAATACKTSATP
jgi:hypothetical protein